MVVMLRTPSVHRLTAVGAQRIEQPCRGHRLQSAVDRGEPDALAASTQLVVELLRRPELLDVLQQRRDRGALPGGTDGRAAHRRSPSGYSTAWARAAITISARW